MEPNPIDLVLFDWGHTLFETASSVEFVMAWAAERGGIVDREAVAQAWESARIESRSPVELAKGRDLSSALHRSCWLALWASLEAVVPGVTDDLYRHETGVEGWQPYIDTEEVLTALAEHDVPVIIVSDVPFDLRPIFDHFGLRHLVHDFVLSGEHGTIKPEGRLFQIALDLAGVPAERALMVGDNPANDGMAASFGIRTLLLPVTPPGRPRGLTATLRLLGF